GVAELHEKPLAIRTNDRRLDPHPSFKACNASPKFMIEFYFAPFRSGADSTIQLTVERIT
ncbi:MAG: hypothetical protein KJ002_15345, partial [Candidatus Dadabacteria bacterium]|nr:hypothetical protein [Candidatus Dadabacteria bacterium]